MNHESSEGERKKKVLFRFYVDVVGVVVGIMTGLRLVDEVLLLVYYCR